MLTHRSLLAAIFLILGSSLPIASQGRSPLLNRIVASVRKENPKWHFIPGVCTCPMLVASQSSYAMGGWYLGKISSSRRVSIYISYVPTAAKAKDWMVDLGRRTVVSGWHRERYRIADEAYLWRSNGGYSYLYFRNDALVIEISGALADVKFFARHAQQHTAPDNNTLDRSGGCSFCIFVGPAWLE